LFRRPVSPETLNTGRFAAYIAISINNERVYAFVDFARVFFKIVQEPFFVFSKLFEILSNSKRYFLRVVQVRLTDLDGYDH